MSEVVAVQKVSNFLAGSMKVDKFFAVSVLALLFVLISFYLLPSKHILKFLSKTIRNESSGWTAPDRGSTGWNVTDRNDTGSESIVWNATDSESAGWNATDSESAGWNATDSESTGSNATCTDMILVKGPIYDIGKFSKYPSNGLVYIIRFYFENLPVSTCISFYMLQQEWRPEYQALNTSKVTDFPDRLFVWLGPEPRMNFGVKNRNLHRYKVAKNLELTRRHLPQAEWIVIIRSDWIMRNLSVIPEYKRLVLESPISDTRGGGLQRHRLVTSHHGYMELNTSEIRFRGSWTWLNDQWMFGHVDDAELYWGFNEYWTMHYPFSRHLQKVSDSRDRFLLTEAEFTQTYLRMLGREFSYTSYRKLLVERFIVANVKTMSMNYHLEYDFPANSSDLIDASCDRSEKRVEHDYCIKDPNLVTDVEEPFAFSSSCLLKGAVYDCSVNTLANGVDPGYYRDERDFYSEGEWNYTNPDVEERFQEEYV